MARPRATYGDPAQDRLEKLRAYDLAAGSDARTQISQDRLDLSKERFLDSQSRDARDYAFRQAQEAAKLEAAASASALKAQGLEQVGAYKDQRLMQMNTQVQLAEQMAALKQAQQEAKDAATLRVAEQATGFLRDARGMDPTKPEFDRQLQELAAGYPMAFEHPGVKEWVGYHKPLREKFVAEEILRRKPDLGERTITTKDGENTTTIKQSMKPGEFESEAAKADLLARHNALVSAIDAKDAGGWTPANAEKIRQVNALKQQLGFVPVDVKGVTDVAAPATALATVAPVLKDKAEFDALPSGSFYMRDGKRFQKP